MLSLLVTVSLFAWASAGTVGKEKGSCVQLLVGYHQCVNKEQSILNKDMASAIAMAKAFGAGWWKGLMNRKFCKFMTAVQDGCEPMLRGHCYNEKEATMWLDMNLAVILDGVQSMLRGWDSEKCPVSKAHFKRMEEARMDEGSDSGCRQVRAEFNDCRKEASSDYVNAMRDGDDGRPDWEARKTCNYDTALLLDCPKHLIGHCHTEEQVAKTSFWESKDESDYQDIKDWDSDKCPAVKAQIAHWKAVVGGDGSLYPRSISLFEFNVFSFLSKIVRLVKKVFQKERICVQNLVDYHDCIYKASIDIDYRALSGPDWSWDWYERNMCNLLTDMHKDCGKVLDNQCYNKKEITMWNDLAMEVHMELMESLFGKLDSTKCPAAKSSLSQNEAGLTDVAGDCSEDKRQYANCRKQANKDYTKAMLNIRYDGRPNFAERKYCNLFTDTMVECPKKLIGDCFSEGGLVKMSFVEAIDDSLPIKDYEDWDSEKCPAVKEHLARWRGILDGDYSGLSVVSSPLAFRLITVSVDILSLATK